MKKLILFAIFAVLIAPNAWALSTDLYACVNPSWVPCNERCCAPTLGQCAQYCGGGITICADLPCENVGAWTNVNDGTNRQFVCNIADKECNYRCPEGYYPSDYNYGFVVVGSGATQTITAINECRKCPTSILGATVATCPGGESLPICQEDTYRVWHSEGTGFQHVVGYATCDNCPYYTTSNNISMPGSAPEGSVGVTSCYIPKGTTMSDTTGTYTISGGDCKYNNVTSGGGLPVTPVG